MASPTVRVNFEMKREEYDEFKNIVSSGGSDVSKCLRILVTKFIQEQKQITFASSVIERGELDATN